jgi:hypothetical protein
MKGKPLWDEHATAAQKRRWARGWTLWTSATLGFNIVVSGRGVGLGPLWWAVDVLAWICALVMLFVYR